MEDIFKIEPQEPIKMSKKEFINKTKELLTNISNSYSQAWQSRALKDNEFPDESICDKCTGHGVFKDNGEEKTCVKDNEQGWCYHAFCDYEEVGMEIEKHIEQAHELLSIDELTE